MKYNDRLEQNELATKALDIAFKIHRQYGPGLFESVYEELFCYEWSKLNIPFLRQHPIPLVHEEVRLEIVFRADVILDRKVLLEFKSVEKIDDIHFKQVSTYLKLTKLKLGILINFNSTLLKDGIHRVANKL